MRLTSLSNWPVSQRLFAVIVLALAMGLVFGALRVADAESSAAQFGQASTLAALANQDTLLIQALQDERDATAGLLNGGNQAVLNPLNAATNAAAARVRRAAAGIGAGYPANIRADVAAVIADISPGQIATLHRTLHSDEDTSAEIGAYGVSISDMITLNEQIAQGVSDSSLVNDVRTLNFLSLATEQVSQQRALLFNLFNDTYFVTGDPSGSDSAELAELTISSAQEDADDAAFQTTATLTEKKLLYNALVSPGADVAAGIEDFVYGNAPTVPTTTPIVPNPMAAITALGFTLKQSPQMWYSSISSKIDDMRSVGQTIEANIATRAHALQMSASQFALVTGVITAVVLLLVLISALFVARSLVLPLRRLRAGALEIASVDLPERVTRISESVDPEPNLDVAPIDVLTTDEIGQVARAFDQVHAEAVRLAGNEAMLRTSFNAVFVNLSRRSQSLIERLARTIDSLEQNEDDPGRLSSLFLMDHLVTRMRRNSENLLLLAGHEGARKWSEPVALADVVGAATSEIEQYSRVELSIQSGVAVIGQAVSDVVHLLAELIENATLFSPRDTLVQVTGQELISGGVLIEITDKGIGVSEARLSEMNWRLDTTPAMDVSVSRHMGLFAVGRLAVRHQVRVRLRPSAPQGLTALVWLPDAVIVRMATGRPRGILEGRRPPAWQSSGMRSAIGGRRAAVAVGATRTDSGRSGSGPEGGPMPNWFRNRRVSATGAGARSGPQNGPQSNEPQSNGGGSYGAGLWMQQQRASEIVADPIRGAQTAAGLPLRVPQANLIPGSAGGAPQAEGGRHADTRQRQPVTSPLSSPLPQRSPDTARSRLGGFQRGARRAEARQQHSVQDREPTVD